MKFAQGEKGSQCGQVLDTLELSGLSYDSCLRLRLNFKKNDKRPFYLID